MRWAPRLLLSGVAVDLDVALWEINEVEREMGSCLEWQLTWMLLSGRGLLSGVAVDLDVTLWISEQALLSEVAVDLDIALWEINQMEHYGLGSYLEWQLTWMSLSGRSTRWSIMGWAPIIWSGS